MSDKHTDEAVGRAKEAAGAITGDEDLKRDGKIEQASASAKDKLDKAADKVKDALSNDDK